MAHAGGYSQPQCMLAVIVLSYRKINGAYILNKKDPSDGAVKRKLHTLKKEKTTSVVAMPRPRSIGAMTESGVWAV